MREWNSNEDVGVLFDESREHRLKLKCTWDDTLPECLYIMLNPSTADNDRCDVTLGRCISLAKSNGFGSIKVVNLYPFRTPKPKLLWQATIKSYVENIVTVTKSMENAGTIIVAWGGQVKKKSDFSWVLDHARKDGKTVYCLGENKSRTPKHPFVERGKKLEKFLYRG